VVGIALSLPAGGQLVIDNIASLARGVSGSPEISIFLRDGVEAAAVEARIAEDADVVSYAFVPRDKALNDLQQSGLGDVLGGLAENPLPDAFVLTPTSPEPETYNALLARFGEWEEVEHAQ